MKESTRKKVIIQVGNSINLMIQLVVPECQGCPETQLLQEKVAIPGIHLGARVELVRIKVAELL